MTTTERSASAAIATAIVAMILPLPAERRARLLQADDDCGDGQRDTGVEAAVRQIPGDRHAGNGEDGEGESEPGSRTLGRSEVDGGTCGVCGQAASSAVA